MPPAEAWPLLTDVARIAPCMPGAKLVEAVDADTWRGDLAVGQHQVRVIAPDVGGGFGPKTVLYPEPFCIVKGAGEGGTIPAPAAIAAALENALEPFGVDIDRVPVTPEWLLDRIDVGRT